MTIGPIKDVFYILKRQDFPESWTMSRSCNAIQIITCLFHYSGRKQDTQTEEY
jgi:hypothetical protein